jgi:hypothetical protein
MIPPTHDETLASARSNRGQVALASQQHHYRCQDCGVNEWTSGDKCYKHIVERVYERENMYPARQKKLE